MTFPRFQIPKNQRRAATTATLSVSSSSVPESVAVVAVVAGAHSKNVFLTAACATARPIDLAAFAERASIIEYDGGMPRAEAEEAAARDLGFDTAEALHRAAIDRWRLEIAATPQTGIRGFDRLATVSLRFLESEWAMKALAADWDETALFAVHEGQSPKERIDAWGLIPFLAWGIHKPSIISFDANACLLRSPAGEPLRQSRSRANFDEAVPWWRHPGIKDAIKGNSHD